MENYKEVCLALWSFAFIYFQQVSLYDPTTNNITSIYILTHLSYSLWLKNPSAAVIRLNMCMAQVGVWMICNKLKFYDENGIFTLKHFYNNTNFNDLFLTFDNRIFTFYQKARCYHWFNLNIYLNLNILTILVNLHQICLMMMLQYLLMMLL